MYQKNDLQATRKTARKEPQYWLEIALKLVWNWSETGLKLVGIRWLPERDRLSIVSPDPNQRNLKWNENYITATSPPDSIQSQASLRASRATRERNAIASALSGRKNSWVLYASVAWRRYSPRLNTVPEKENNLPNGLVEKNIKTNQNRDTQTRRARRSTKELYVHGWQFLPIVRIAPTIVIIIIFIMPRFQLDTIQSGDYAKMIYQPTKLI